MVKVFVVLLVGLLLESAGVVLLRSGLKDLMPEEPHATWRTLQTVAMRGLALPKVWLGIFCEALYFFTLLYLLSQRGLSFVWPLTSLGFVITALAAWLLLDEPVGWLRWIGIILIVIGAGLVTYTEQQTGAANQ